MGEEPAEPSLAQIDAVLAFLPVFERPGFSFGAWQLRWLIFPQWEPSPEAAAFVETLYRERFIIPFDWASWGAEAERYTAGGAAALAEADLSALRRLLTTYVRADRFTAGTLASQLESGQVTAVLRRLAQLREWMEQRQAPGGAGG